VLLSLVSSCAGVRLAHDGPLLVSVFDTMPTRASLEAVGAAQAHLLETHDHISSLVIIPPVQRAGVSPTELSQPSAERERALSTSAHLSSTFEGRVVAGAVVVLMPGLVSVMVRSFLAAMVLLSPSRMPLKTFRDLGESLAWMGEVPGAPPLPDGAHEAIARWLNDAAA
jgi:hypothetical protein